MIMSSGLREWFAQRDGTHGLPPVQRMAKLGSEMLPGKKLRKRHTPPEIPSLTQMLSVGQASYFDESEFEEDDFKYFTDSEVRPLHLHSPPVGAFSSLPVVYRLEGDFKDLVRTVSGQHVTTKNGGYQFCRAFI